MFCFFVSMSLSQWEREKQPLTSRSWLAITERVRCSAKQSSLTEHQHQMRELWDHDRSRQKRDYSVITSEQNKTWTLSLSQHAKHPSVQIIWIAVAYLPMTAIVSLYSSSFSTYNSLSYSTIALTPFANSTQSTVNFLFLESFPKSPKTRSDPTITHSFFSMILSWQWNKFNPILSTIAGFLVVFCLDDIEAR